MLTEMKIKFPGKSDEEATALLIQVERYVQTSFQPNKKLISTQKIVSNLTNLRYP